MTDEDEYFQRLSKAFENDIPVEFVEPEEYNLLNFVWGGEDVYLVAGDKVRKLNRDVPEEMEIIYFFKG